MIVKLKAVTVRERKNGFLRKRQASEPFPIDHLLSRKLSSCIFKQNEFKIQM